MSELRLLVVSESLGRGGAEQALVNILPALRNHGCECDVAVLHPPYTLQPELEGAGIPIHRLGLNHRWNIPQGVARLTALLRARNYDVVHGHLFFAGMYIALTRPFCRRPYRVVTFHNLGYDSYPANDLWRKTRKGFDGWMMRHGIDGRIAVSAAVARHYQSHLGLPDMDVIPNAFQIDGMPVVSEADRTRVREAYGLGAGDFVLLMCGRLVMEKGHRYLIDAIDLLRRRGLRPAALIVGDGPLWGEIHDDIERRELADRVRLEPAMSHVQLLRVMQAADLVVMASTHEGFPLSPGEAMALGRPVLATRVGGIPDLIEEGRSGVLVDPADPCALATAIATMMNSPELCEQLGRQAARRIRERFGAENLSRVWMDYYTAAASASPTGTPSDPTRAAVSRSRPAG